MESMQTFKKDFTGDLYREGKQWEDDGIKCSPWQYAGLKAYKAGVWPDDKELDQLTNRLVTELQIKAFEQTRTARAREYAAHKWVMDAYFKDCGVEPEGVFAPSVEKAFQVVPAELTVFPFFWDNIIVEGILAVPLLDILVMATESINSGTAVHAVMNETVQDRTMGETGEFATFQEVNVSSTESTVRLKKFGAQISVSDEVMRRQRLPVFQRGMARYGRQIGIDITDLCMETLINGDTAWGGASGAATTVAAGVSGSPAYSDYVSVLMNFDIGYEPTDVVLGRAGLIKLINVPEFKDPLAGFRMQSEGLLPEPFGLMTHRWDATRSTGWSAAGVAGDSTKMLALQRGRALILYQEGGLATESDRDPRTQTTAVVTSWYVIPAVADRNAVRVGTGFA